mmetsp:Transcript_17722/g.31590  ORF Transcript_17722/g.31590 Transcript_17722/m.31590 type:complete len:95 (+) Transcript_17722:145-429(+)
MFVYVADVMSGLASFCLADPSGCSPHHAGFGDLEPFCYTHSRGCESAQRSDLHPVGPPLSSNPSLQASRKPTMLLLVPGKSSKPLGVKPLIILN